jgi:hypothetical protein
VLITSKNIHITQHDPPKIQDHIVEYHIPAYVLNSPFSQLIKNTIPALRTTAPSNPHKLLREAIRIVVTIIKYTINSIFFS